MSASLDGAVAQVLASQSGTGKPLAIVLAGHNGSGKSTLWYGRLAPEIRIPLINADRMMMSILPEPDEQRRLPAWASELRDGDEGWMRVAQKGVEAFVVQAMAHRVPFAMETVFSHWERREDGTFASKADLVRDMQRAGYFVVLVFVGLSSEQLSIARVSTRVAGGGHDVDVAKLLKRFPRTQEAISHALTVADAALLLDNSRAPEEAFTLCRIQLGARVLFDLRDQQGAVPPAISAWLDRVARQPSPSPDLGPSDERRSSRDAAERSSA